MTRRSRMSARSRGRLALACVATLAALTLLVTGCGSGGETVTVTAPAQPPAAPPATPPPPPATAPATPPATTPAPVPSPAPPPATVPVAPPAAPSAPEARVPRPADFPNAEEAALLARVRQTAGPFCTRSAEDDRAQGSSASLICDLRQADRVQVFIENFDSVAGMNAVLRQSRMGLRPTGKRELLRFAPRVPF